MADHPLKQLLSNDTIRRESAAEEVDNVFRTTAWEQSFVRECLDSKNITPEECDVLPTTTKPVKFDRMEQECERAVTIPFGGQPINSYMHLPMFITTFARNVSARLYDDKDNLLMYRADIERLFYTLLLREVMDREVRAFVGTMDLLCGDLDDATSTASVETGGLAFASIGAIGRSSMMHGMKSMGATYGSLAVKRILMNNQTVWDLLAEMDTANVGDGMAEKTWLEGYSVMESPLGVDLMVTLKNRVVLDSVLYLLTDAEHLGKMYILEDATLVNEQHVWFVDMFLYLNEGGSMPNAGAFRKLYAGGVAVNSFKIEDYVESS